MKLLNKLESYKQIYNELVDQDFSNIDLTQNLYFYQNPIENWNLIFRKPNKSEVLKLQYDLAVSEGEEIKTNEIIIEFIVKCCISVSSDDSLRTTLNRYNISKDLIEDLIDTVNTQSEKIKQLQSIVKEIKDAIKTETDKAAKRDLELQLLAVNNELKNHGSLFEKIRDGRDINSFAVAFCSIINNKTEEAFAIGSLLGETLLRINLFLSESKE